jgi:hypothetical protein
MFCRSKGISTLLFYCKHRQNLESEAPLQEDTKKKQETNREEEESNPIAYEP